MSPLTDPFKCCDDRRVIAFGLPALALIAAFVVVELRTREPMLDVRIFGNALLMSVFGAGIQLSQIPQFGQNFQGPTAGNVLGAAVGQQFGSTASEFIRRGMSVAPTLDVRPGFPFNVMVTQDVIFPEPYQENQR